MFTMIHLVTVWRRLTLTLTPAKRVVHLKKQNSTEYIWRSCWLCSAVDEVGKHPTYQRAAEKEWFLKVKWGWDKEVINGKKNYFRWGHLPLGEGGSISGGLSHCLGQEIPGSWVKAAFLGEAETTIWLGIKSQCADMGLSTSDFILGPLSLFHTSNQLFI